MNARKRQLALVLAASCCGCTPTWSAFRHDPQRTGAQPFASALSDPARVPSLAVRWTFSLPSTAFRASPVVYAGHVLLGNSNGRFYSLNADTGALEWQYPPAASPALTSTFTCNPSSVGIASSAAISQVGSTVVVVFAAPDRSIGTGLGEGRLFALDVATGAEVWKSPVIARLTGTNSGSTSEFHEQMGYSAPAIFGGNVYVGIGDHCDSPIQKGRVAAVDVATGGLTAGFSYCSTGTCSDATRGGGVWSPVAASTDGLFITTGNTKRPADPEPSPNLGLSMLKLEPTTGTVQWQFQPVPWALDGDPDWSAPPTIMGTTCGSVAISTQKDGWTHALDAPAGTRRWSFPNAAIPFSPADGTVHGDTRYMRGGAAWGDVYIAMTGGLNLTTTGVSGGFGRLHAFNVCAAAADRVRWIVDVPNSGSGSYRLSPPSVSRGIIYVGTTAGHLVAIADPSIYPAAGWRCTNPEIASASCVSAGYTLVPDPAVLADVTLSGAITYTEPVLIGGRVYVSTAGGNVYMLSPS